MGASWPFNGTENASDGPSPRITLEVYPPAAGEADAACDEPVLPAALRCGDPAEVGGIRKLQRTSRLTQLLHCGFDSSHCAVTAIR